MELCNNRPQEEKQQLGDIAQSLFATLLGDPERFPDLPAWRHKKLDLSIEELANIFIAFSMIDNDLAEKTLDYMLIWSELYEMDEVLLPTALYLAAATSSGEPSVIARLRQLVIVYLQARLAKQLEPPTDWSREYALECHCKDCQELSLFLKSPNQEQWRFKAAEARRKHLEHNASRSNCDVAFVTDKNKRPYTLVGTKNQASYLCKVERSKSDQDALECLLAVG